jgi:glycosyltransferase involved in cell wall biosynthesis
MYRVIPRPRVLSCIGAFWPGNDSSGANQSFKALATALRDDVDFHLLARACPFGEKGAAPATSADLGFAMASYLTVTTSGVSGLRRRLCTIAHDVLWLNGFFDRELTVPALVMRRFGCIPRKPTILSPRGEFFAGALHLKALRKRIFIVAHKLLPLLDGVIIHATTEDERAACLSMLGTRARIVVAPDTPLLLNLPARRTLRRNGALGILFVGRVARVKNLDYALRVLTRVRSRVHLDIIGPPHEEDYWRECEALISALPANVTASFRGVVEHQAIIQALAGADLLLLPTAGENFGHAIFEALSCGVPVLISDRTPWRGLEARGAGWDLPLDDPTSFADAIDRFASLGPDEIRQLQAGARAYASGWLAASDTMDRNRGMLLSAMETSLA